MKTGFGDGLQSVHVFLIPGFFQLKGFPEEEATAADDRQNDEYEFKNGFENFQLIFSPFFDIMIVGMTPDSYIAIFSGSIIAN